MSVDYLSALNKQGSGLNITQIVDSLVQAETAPLSSQIEQKIEKSNQQISGYAIVAAELGKMKDYTASIKGSTAYSVSSDNGAVGARVVDQSQAADFNAKISVSSLAVAQTLEFTGFSSKSDTIGTGTINIDFGDWSSGSFVTNNNKTGQTITINESNNTLSDLAQALNSLEGVNATVTNKGDGTYSLIVNSATGSKNALRLTATEDSGSTGLSQFDNTITNNSKQVVAAADAQLNINGVDISRENNTITDLIDGYEFNLTGVTSTAASVSGSVNPDLAFQQVKDFVDIFNSVNGTLSELTKKGINGEEAGVLARDVVLSGIQRELRSVVTTGLAGFDDRTRYISELGIKTAIPSEPSIALGSSEVNLIELTSAYAGILNNGIRVYPKGWRDLSIKETNEVIIREGSEPGFRVFSKLAAQTLKYLMFSSVENGTGKNASVSEWQIAGKTGTSQSFRDAWFVGFSNNYVIGVWMGNDDNQPLKNVNGGGLPAKIFSKIMTKISPQLVSKKEIAMISPDQFDTLRNYDETATKFQFQSQGEADGKPKTSSLIGGLIRALLWGD